ncbi:MAG: hypothetical protein OXR64_14465 [Chloroflexota bacterium]|nr:hypothetical protein [Chloroflexota bacterium]MDE2921035.1 hypothetical protein [Chloroflexota bacterium]
MSVADGAIPARPDFRPARSSLDSTLRFADVSRRSEVRLVTLFLMHTSGFWLVAGLLALIETAIVVKALRMRVRTSGPLSIVGRRPAEIGWTLLPALLLAVLVWLSLQPQ